MSAISTLAIDGTSLSAKARHLWFLADKARNPRTGVVLFGRLIGLFGFKEQIFWDCFEELCAIEVVPATGVTTVIPFEGDHPPVGRLRAHLWARRRKIVFERDGFRCKYCGSRDEDLHCDQIVPISRGGSKEVDNLTTSCAPGNLSKRDKLLSEWRQ